MNNRTKNLIILIILLSFLLTVFFIPVNCFFKEFTGIYCPSCKMTRAFYLIFNFDFFNAFRLNILSIPLFIFIIFFILSIFIDLIKNQFNFIPNLLKCVCKYYIIILFLIFISFIYNNIELFI